MIHHLPKFPLVQPHRAIQPLISLSIMMLPPSPAGQPSAAAFQPWQHPPPSPSTMTSAAGNPYHVMLLVKRGAMSYKNTESCRDCSLGFPVFHWKRPGLV
jgi:hypothetical protein